MIRQLLEKAMKTGNLILKNISILIILFCFALKGYSQEADTQQDAIFNKRAINVTNIKDLTKNGFNFWQDNFKGHFAGIDFGFNTFVKSNYRGYPPDEWGFMENNYYRSNSLFINIIQQSINLQHNRNTLGLVTGAGLQMQSYRLNQNITIEERLSGKIVPAQLSYKDNQKSKLYMAYLIIPFLAEIQIPVKHYANRLYFSGGFYAGIRISSHTKIKYRRMSQKEKLKTPGDFSLHKIKSGLMFRTGYRWVNIFATYDLTPLFKNSLGPELTPVTVGVTLMKF
ncbi:hypothetical protein MNBD_BACTEROID01-1166 [hydrothermal vent metagenome]|uniref:Uncharacterized protein n=1 Tax=hydrothermal vent metagenome TaxID=652676 RepID=A0A3B0TUF5_9ZZZZ